MRSSGYLLLSIGLAALSSSQSLDAASCIGPLTTASNCNFYASKLNACNSLTGSAAASCYCPQTVFNALVLCEGEFRICFASDYYDPAFEDPSTGLFTLWHSACDAAITYTVTTPVAAEPSITIDVDYCNSIDNDCIRFGSLTDSCTAAYTAESDILNCYCQSSIISLASRCQIDGSSSCLLESVATTSLWSYRNCRNGASAGAQATATTPTATVISSRISSVVSDQGGSIASATAEPSSLPSVPALSTATSSVSSWSAASARPNLWQVMATAVCSIALLIAMM